MTYIPYYIHLSDLSFAGTFLSLEKNEDKEVWRLRNSVNKPWLHILVCVQVSFLLI